MKLAVFGSRSLSGAEVEMAIRETILEQSADAILTAGEPDGVCKTAQAVARAIPLPLTLFFLDFQYLKGAFDHRSRAIVAASDFVLVIHDGKSKGTANEHELVQRLKKPHKYITLEAVKSAVTQTTATELLAGATL